MARSTQLPQADIGVGQEPVSDWLAWQLEMVGTGIDQSLRWQQALWGAWADGLGAAWAPWTAWFERGYEQLG